MDRDTPEAQIKRGILGLGADLCGIASIDRFADAPADFHPAAIFPGCESVIVVEKRLPKGAGMVSPRIVYNKANDMSVFEVDRIAYLAALEAESFGGTAVSLPSDSPYEYWDADTLTGRGVLSMRHAAVQAGLGTLGKNSLLITRLYGNMVTIGAVLTSLRLVSDPLSEELCIASCRRCLDACPQHALGGGGAKQERCRPHTYGSNARGFSVVNCNACRTVCPRAFGVPA
jgi:epoxyqueuosine reductase QueG